MSRNHFVYLILSSLYIETATAKSMIDCRVATADITGCNPYGEKFLKSKKIVYESGRHKLIREKTLPVPEKKRFVKVVSVEDMIERHVKVQESLRFKGNEKVPVKPIKIKEPVPTVILDERIEEIEVSEVPPRIERELLEKIVPEKPQIVYGQYRVVSGDALSKIAKKFGLKTKEIATINGITLQSSLRVGQTLKLPFEQKMIDAISSGKYIIEKGDSLISIAKKFKLYPRELAEFNGIKNYALIRVGKIIKLPLPHILAQIKTKKILRVTATAYTSHKGQTDSTPFLAAWNNRLRPGMKIIAVSRDMLTRYGMRNGTKVRISGLPGYYTVRDKMNKRYKRRIDIYMGLDKRKALRWGRRSVVVYWN
jgi:LysM repeat protein